ncbi:MAG: TIGR02594 family protein [Limnobacter sp.]|nr:TIGR02594 family protein [Limnobacter sp.]
MATPRILTDVPPGRLHLLLALIEEDGGTAVHERQLDGRFTVTASLPGAPAPIAEPAPGSDEFEWMTVARAEIGPMRAIVGRDDPRIVDYQAGIRRADPPDAVPWCASFVDYCMSQAGFAGTGSGSARSWLHWGREAQELVPGCIVVLARGTPPRGHVGFYAGRDGALRILVLGGNGKDAVGVASFDAAAVLGRRLPARTAATRPATMADMSRWIVALRVIEGAQASASHRVAEQHRRAEQDLRRAGALRERIVAAGTRFAIPPSLLAAIAGRGASPDGIEHVGQAAGILASLRIRLVTRYPDWTDARILRAAVAAYLRSADDPDGRARLDAPAIGTDEADDTDSAEVLARAKAFDALLAFDPA